MINVDLSNVETNSRPGPGGYVAMITDIDHVIDKQYIRIYADIAEGEFTQYYDKLYESRDFWGLTGVRSYKPKALKFFKEFVTAVEESNPGYKWDGDETRLIGKAVGIILRNEQYTSASGELKLRLIIDKYVPTETIRSGDFEVPDTKWVEKPNYDFVDVKEEEVEGIPFK